MVYPSWTEKEHLVLHAAICLPCLLSVIITLVYPLRVPSSAVFHIMQVEATEHSIIVAAPNQNPRGYGRDSMESTASLPAPTASTGGGVSVGVGSDRRRSVNGRRQSLEATINSSPSAFALLMHVGQDLLLEFGAPDSSSGCQQQDQQQQQDVAGQDVSAADVLAEAPPGTGTLLNGRNTFSSSPGGLDEISGRGGGELLSQFKGVQLQVVVHYGRLHAAIIGSRRPRYRLIGQAVECARAACRVAPRLCMVATEPAAQKLQQLGVTGLQLHRNTGRPGSNEVKIDGGGGPLKHLRDKIGSRGGKEQQGSSDAAENSGSGSKRGSNELYLIPMGKRNMGVLAAFEWVTTPGFNPDLRMLRTSSGRMVRRSWDSGRSRESQAAGRCSRDSGISLHGQQQQGLEQVQELHCQEPKGQPQQQVRQQLRQEPRDRRGSHTQSRDSTVSDAWLASASSVALDHVKKWSSDSVLPTQQQETLSQGPDQTQQGGQQQGDNDAEKAYSAQIGEATRNNLLSFGIGDGSDAAAGLVGGLLGIEGQLQDATAAAEAASWTYLPSDLPVRRSHSGLGESVAASAAGDERAVERRGVSDWRARTFSFRSQAGRHISPVGSEDLKQATGESRGAVLGASGKPGSLFGRAGSLRPASPAQGTTPASTVPGDYSKPGVGRSSFCEDQGGTEPGKQSVPSVSDGGGTGPPPFSGNQALNGGGASLGRLMEGVVSLSTGLPSFVEEEGPRYIHRAAMMGSNRSGSWEQPSQPSVHRPRRNTSFNAVVRRDPSSGSGFVKRSFPPTAPGQVTRDVSFNSTVKRDSSFNSTMSNSTGGHTPSMGQTSLLVGPAPWASQDPRVQGVDFYGSGGCSGPSGVWMEGCYPPAGRLSPRDGVSGYMLSQPAPTWEDFYGGRGGLSQPLRRMQAHSGSLEQVGVSFGVGRGGSDRQLGQGCGQLGAAARPATAAGPDQSQLDMVVGGGGEAGGVGMDHMDELEQVMLMQQELTFMQRQLLAHKAAIQRRLCDEDPTAGLGANPAPDDSCNPVHLQEQQQQGERRWQVQLQQQEWEDGEQGEGLEQGVELSAAQLVEPLQAASGPEAVVAKGVEAAEVAAVELAAERQGAAEEGRTPAPK